MRQNNKDVAEMAEVFEIKIEFVSEREIFDFSRHFPHQGFSRIGLIERFNA